MENISIEIAKKEHCEIIYNMVCKLEESKLNKNHFKEIYKTNIAIQNIYYLIVFIGNNPVGFASMHIQKLLHHCGNVAEVQELFIEPDLRCNGIGNILFDKLKMIALERKCVLFEVSCNLKREKAHLFYEREQMKKSHYKFTYKL